MTDLAERLRQQAWQRSGAPKMDAGHAKMLEWEAADEIERLRAEFELFREAPSKLEVAQYEIEQLRAKLAEYENVPVRLRHIMRTGKMPPDDMK